MRPRLLPLTLLLCASALAPARLAAADDGSIIKRNPTAPIAGTAIWSKIEVEAPIRKPKSAALVILGAIIGALGAAGAVTGSVLVATSAGACPKTLDAAGNPIRTTDQREFIIDPTTHEIVTDAERVKKGVKVKLTSEVAQCTGADPRREMGITTLLVSAAAAAAGLTAVLVGIQPRADEPADARTRLIPTVAVGPTGGSLTWRF